MSEKQSCRVRVYALKEKEIRKGKEWAKDILRECHPFSIFHLTNYCRFPTATFTRNAIKTMEIIEPFVHLPEFHVVICKCQLAVTPVPNRLKTHLSGGKHRWKSEERRRIVHRVSGLKDLIRDRR